MSLPKYKQQLQTMLEDNKEVFDEYLKLENDYEIHPAENKEKLIEMKKVMQRIVRKNEDRLCAKTENTKRYSSYSEGLSAKFWEEVRKIFPKIDVTLE